MFTILTLKHILCFVTTNSNIMDDDHVIAYRLNISPYNIQCVHQFREH